MKKLYSLFASTVLVFAANAQTNVLLEGFPYADGTSLSTENTTTGWFQHSGTQGQITVTGGQANLVSGNSEDINKALTTSYSLSAAGAAYKVVVTATVTVQNGTGLNTTGDYFLSLAGSTTTSNVTTGITALPARLYVKSSTAGALFGTVNNSGTGSTPSFVTTAVPYGTATPITLTYEVTKDASGTVTLQQSTLQVGSETITNTTGTQAPPTTIAAVALRQGSGTGNISINDLSVTTYAAVLGVSDITSVRSNFVKNTLVNEEISFVSKSEVKIYSMNGQMVRSANVNEFKPMNVSDLAPGMYIVTGTVDGQPVSQKILKK